MLLSVVLLAQNMPISLPKVETYTYDTAYIKSYNSKLALRFVIPRRFEKFVIKDAQTGQKYVYNANEHYGVGVGFTYKWLAVDMTLNPKFTQRNPDKFGATREFNLKGSVYLKRTLVDGYLRRYQGYFVKNPEATHPDWQPGMPYPQRPDIKTTGWGINFTVPFNWEQYTPKVTFVLDGKLKKSAGSFMAVANLYGYHMRADSSIVDSSFKPEAQLRKMNLVLVGGLFGYSYTYVKNNFYGTLGAFPGVTFPLGEVYHATGKATPVFTANFKLMVRGGIGYNVAKWYTGIYFIVDSNNLKLPENILLTNNLGEIRFFVGYRIPAPKLVDEVMDKIN